MWDWVGGRTSELSAVGLLPAALQGFNITNLLLGACEIDKITRNKNVKANPALQLALAWFESGNGKGIKKMAILPYKDRLELFSRYLQQLVMESLGKELDLGGNTVNQGITVFGNKGSTDQHAYVQQLRDGQNDFFVTFIEVQNVETHFDPEVEPGITSSDYLQGFYLGTRQALAEKSRESITIIIKQFSPFSLGMLIALFERAVGFYASLVNINAYNQPGVEAGKKAATKIIDIERKILNLFTKNIGQTFNIKEIADKISEPEDIESVFRICEFLAANPSRKILKSDGKTVFDSAYGSN